MWHTKPNQVKWIPTQSPLQNGAGSPGQELESFRWADISAENEHLHKTELFFAKSFWRCINDTFPSGWLRSWIWHKLLSGGQSKCCVRQRSAFIETRRRVRCSHLEQVHHQCGMRPAKALSDFSPTLQWSPARSLPPRRNKTHRSLLGTLGKVEPPHTDPQPCPTALVCLLHRAWAAFGGSHHLTQPQLPAPPQPKAEYCCCFNTPGSF